MPSAVDTVTIKLPIPIKAGGNFSKYYNKRATKPIATPNVENPTVKRSNWDHKSLAPAVPLLTGAPLLESPTPVALPFIEMLLLADMLVLVEMLSRGEVLLLVEILSRTEVLSLVEMLSLAEVLSRAEVLLLENVLPVRLARLVAELGVGRMIVLDSSLK
jgi:hypothetical protein